MIKTRIFRISYSEAVPILETVTTSLKTTLVESQLPFPIYLVNWMAKKIMPMLKLFGNV